MPILTGTLKSVGGTPFGGPGCAVVIYSRITRPGPGKSMILELQDRIGMPAENAGVFTSGSMPSGPVRVMLEGNDVHGQAWDITLPEGEDALQLTDLVETQIDWSPMVVSRSEAAARAATEAQAGAESARDAAVEAVGSTVWTGDVLTVNGVSSPPLTGPQGDEGPAGPAATITSQEALPTGDVQVTFSDGTVVVVPAAADGEDGVSPVLTAGTATTLPAGSAPTVSITGPQDAPVLDLGVPLPARSPRILIHTGTGDPVLTTFPDAQVGDLIERVSDGQRWKVEAS